ncbi:MAG TPA: M13-type metalloendopeptidase [Caldimonas sp.]|jgi:predicted metalloendopeptidase|nr:M13-type metalloendopeptidase [Caldimonas sp.]HEX4236089.1 M13-type metalloendopeptidase [Caldimonas sp.]
MKRLLLVLACSAALLAGCAAIRPVHSGIDLGGGDPTVRPQDDLYARVNGKWVRTTEIPADKSYIGSWVSIEDAVQEQLHGLLEAAASQRADADARRIADLYASFMDEAAVERAGLAPLAAELAAIDAIASPAELGRAMGRLERLGVDMPFHVGIEQDARDATRYVPVLGQGGLGLPDRDYYLVTTDAKFAAARSSYAAYLTKLLQLANAGDDAAASAAAVIALETALARGQWTRVDNRDPVKTYNKVETSALATLAPGFDWAGWLSAIGLAGKSGDVVVNQPSYLGALSAQLGATPLPVWKTYLRTRLLSVYAPYLGKEFVDARFAFVGTALAGVTQIEPRWKRGVVLVDRTVGESLGKRYVAAYFPPQSKARMEQLVANLLATYRESIDTIDWMGPATKKEAQAKLATFAPKIGYPKRWIDYSTLDIEPGDLVGNVERADAFDWARDVGKLGKPVDRDEWFMTPQTVNAYYNALLNEIVFPAAILQPPMFDPRADDAVNYGAIGAIIGHEISHGFDDEGSQYDGTGNLRVWWTDEDRQRFEAKTKLLVQQYSALSPIAGYTINGELTLGENIADNSGLEIAYKAYQRSLGGRPAPVIDGMTGDERFFYGFAQAYRAKTRESMLLTWIKSDPHSPDEFRVIGTVRNHSAFYSTFGVRPGDKMYLPPERRVSIW